jgi:putative ABC transport system substrate-binding protein
MRRRLYSFLTSLARAALHPACVVLSTGLFSGLALAQQATDKVVRIGWASVYPLAQVETLLQAFRNGLAAHGYVEGRNLELVLRSAEGVRERVPALLDELVGLKPDVIVSHAAATFAARRITTVPVVYVFSGDPVAAELTDSLARPSRNLTGISLMSVELNEKRLDLLRQMAPQVKTVVLMGDPIHPGADLEVEASRTMARELNLEILWRPTGSSQEVVDLLSALEDKPPDALVVLPDAVMLDSRKHVAEFATRHHIPSVSGWSTFAHSGGLFTYGPRLPETFRRLADYVVRILQGAKPSDLPVERPTVFELVINSRTAKEIGLDIPPSLLARAAEVIE